VLDQGVVEDVFAGRRAPELRQLMGRRIVLEAPGRY